MVRHTRSNVPRPFDALPSKRPISKNGPDPVRHLELEFEYNLRVHGVVINYMVSQTKKEKQTIIILL